MAEGLVQVSFALAVFGLEGIHASETLTDLTALAALIVAADAAWVGNKRDVSISAEMSPAISLSVFFTCSAYALNLKTC